MEQALLQFVLDVRHHFPLVFTILDIQHDKAVQRVTMCRGVDLGVDDALAGAGKEADDAGKQVGLVLGVHHDLQAEAFLIGAGADDGLVVEDAVMQ